MSALIERKSGDRRSLPIEAVDAASLAAARKRLTRGAEALARRLPVRRHAGQLRADRRRRRQAGARTGRRGCRRCARRAGRAAVRPAGGQLLPGRARACALDTAPGGAGLGAGRLPVHPLSPAAPRCRPRSRVPAAELQGAGAAGRRPPRWCATWSTRRPRTWVRSNWARRSGKLGKAHKAKVRDWVGDELLKANFPTIHAVGRASHREPRLIELSWGKASRSEAGDRRQGRVLRHRRPEPQGRRRHALDEEGHGRRRARDRAGRPGDGSEAAGAAEPAGARGGKCRGRQRDASGRGDHHPRRPHRGGGQHRRRRPAGAVRCADLRLRAEARPDRRLRHPHRRRARGAGAGPARAVQQPRRAGRRRAGGRPQRMPIRCGSCRCGSRTAGCSTPTWPTSPTPAARAMPARSPRRCTWSASCRRRRRGCTWTPTPGTMPTARAVHAAARRWGCARSSRFCRHRYGG